MTNRDVLESRISSLRTAAHWFAVYDARAKLPLIVWAVYGYDEEGWAVEDGMVVNDGGAVVRAWEIDGFRGYMNDGAL
jgi:hypothetical protein